MNKVHLLSLLFFMSGIVFFAYGILCGEVETGFVFIFPFLKGSGFYAFVGFICVFVAVLLFMFGFVTSAVPGYRSDEMGDTNVQSKRSVHGGGVVLIGPIPIVFGSNWKIAVVLMLVALGLIIVVLAAIRFWFL